MTTRSTAPSMPAPGGRSPSSPVISRRRGVLRRQLPVASPISADALIRSFPRGRAEVAQRRLSELLGEQYEAEGVRLCSSGTQALQLAISVAWETAGRRGHVALPAFACYDLVTAAAGAQVPVSFFDLDPATLGPDPVSLEGTLKAGASVVVVAPLYGVPVDWDHISKVCEAHGAVVIEDAAQGHGALWKDKTLGAHGDLSVLSFGRGKGWTGGAGGALLGRGRLSDLALLPALPASSRGAEARTLVRMAAQLLMGRPSVFGMVAAIPGLRLGETIYHPPSTPTAMPRVAVDLAVAHHEVARDHAERRRGAAREWAAALRGLPGIELVEVPNGGEGGYLRYPILVATMPEDPNAMRIGARFGIARAYPQPLPRLGVLRVQAEAPRSGWPGAERLSKALLTLPTHWQVSREDRAGALDLLATYFVKGAVR